MAYVLLTPSDADLAKLVAVQFAETRSGSAQVCLTFRIHDEQSPNIGRVTTYFGSFGDKSIDFTVDALRACGWHGDDLSDLPAALERGELDHEVSLKIVLENVTDAKGNPVLVDGEPKVRDRVAFVNVPGAGGAGFRAERPIEGDDLRRLGADLRTAVAAAGKRRPSGGSSPSPARGGGSSNRSRSSGPPARDDVPPPDDRDAPQRGW